MYHSVEMMQLLYQRGVNPTQTTKASVEPEKHENIYINTLKWIRDNVGEMYKLKIRSIFTSLDGGDSGTCIEAPIIRIRRS